MVRSARRHAGTLALGLVLAWCAAPAAAWLHLRIAPPRDGWVALLPPPRVGRLRAALLVDARDCPATLQLVDLFARRELAGAIGGVTLLVRDGRDSLVRYADARLTGDVQVGVVPVPRPMRRALRSLGRGAWLVLVDAGGRAVWTTRADRATTSAPTFVPTLRQVAEHHLATALTSASTAALARPRPSR